MDYKVIDMSNQRYFIIGIRLTKGVQSYFYMNRDSEIKEITITDKDMESIQNNELVFSIKGLEEVWLEKMINIFDEVLKKYNINIRESNVKIDIQNKEVENKLYNILIGLGLYKDKSSKKATIVSEVSISEELEDSVVKNDSLEKVNDEVSKIEVNSRVDDVESFSSLDSSKDDYSKDIEYSNSNNSFLDMDIYGSKDRYEFDKKNLKKNSGNKSKIAIILFVISAIMILLSVVLYFMR